MKKINKILLLSFALFISILPVFSFAQTKYDFTKGLVLCDGSASNPCDYNAFLKLINIIINFFLYISIPICAISFAWAGFLLITSGSGEGKTKAKEIFSNAVIGLLFIVGAFLIVKTILYILGYNGAWIGF